MIEAAAAGNIVEVRADAAGILDATGPDLRVRDRRDGPEVLTRRIEERLVEAAWTLARLPDRERAWIYGQTRHGMDYVNERSDDEDAVPRPMRPAAPSPGAISRWSEALDWLRCLSPEQARLVFGAVLSRRGDMARRISWEKVRRLSGLQVSRQRLSVLYDRALGDIAAELQARSPAGGRG